MSLCCCSCLDCCFPAKDKPKYSQVSYTSPEKANISVEMPEVLETPLVKRFEYPQQRTEFPVHPQIVPGGSSLSEKRKSRLSSGYYQSQTHGRASEADSRRSSAESLQQMEQYSAASQVEEGVLPTLHFSLYYDLQRQMLTLHLQKATDLPTKDQRHTSDPFVVAHLEPSKVEIYQSKIIYKTLNPYFGEMFEFGNLTSEEVHQQTIIFRIYDHDKYCKSNFIGVIRLPLREADLLGVAVRMEIDEDTDAFRSETKGDLLLSLNYMPEQGEVQGVVFKVINLQKQDVIGLTDPYVKIYLMYEGKRRSKWKTSTKRNTLLPVFNEAFVFNVSRLNIRDITMEIAVMNYDQFKRNGIIGTVHIGESVGQESGRAHWSLMMSSAHTPVSQWHPIMPPVSGHFSPN